MSVRGELGKQPGDDVRLQDITIDVPEEREEVEISDKDWGIMKERYEFLKENWLPNVRHIARMKVLSPDKFEELSLGEKEWTEILEEWNDPMNTFFVPEWADYYKYFKILSPEKASKMTPITEEQVKYHNDLRKKEGDWSRLIKETANYKFCYPEKLEKLIDLNEIWEKGLEEYKKYADAENWAGAIFLAANLRILFPDRQIVSEEDLLNMKILCKKVPPDSVPKTQGSKISRYKYSLKLITADKVKVTDEGLEVVMPSTDSYKQETPPRPQRKELN
ncbi:MAG: hypothetical protein HQ530_04215 [Parcubacteria group bacterium]|nr:hypothetical protein [Parcubacteria group bacterium]